MTPNEKGAPRAGVSGEPSRQDWRGIVEHCVRGVKARDQRDSNTPAVAVYGDPFPASGEDLARRADVLALMLAQRA